jgi:hypothetical protein
MLRDQLLFQGLSFMAIAVQLMLGDPNQARFPNG